MTVHDSLMRGSLPVLLFTALLLGAAGMRSEGARAAELRGSASVEGRFFTAGSPYKGAFDADTSLALNPEFIFSNEEGDQSLTFTPFYRQDNHDSKRRHGDVRELYWLYLGQRIELSAGIRKVFWGATESQHLVDVINQTDLVEDLDLEDKLGQPMISTTFLTGPGALDIYLMPHFRERTFPEDGRLQLIPDDQFSDRALYQSSEGDHHTDWAVRWSQTLGYWDIGLSHFYGTNREPLFIPAGDGRLHPYYELMHQTGLDIQGAAGAWLWKLEAIYRDTASDEFFAMTGGFEYTWYQVGESALDIGLVAEYLKDNRDVGSTPFDDDLMLGIRLSPNDLQGSEFLLGVIEDRGDHSRFYRLEAGTRITDHLRVDVQATVFSGTGKRDPFFTLRNDDLIQAELAWYF